MDELVAQGATNAEIASRLSDMGLKTRRGNEFTAKRVQQTMYLRKKRSRAKVARRTAAVRGPVAPEERVSYTRAPP
jgi:hypothetical protein